MCGKLKNRAGETLAEVLVSILVIAFAVLLLASMVSASGSIDLSTRERDEKFYQDLTNAETHHRNEGSPVTVNVTVTWTPEDSVPIDWTFKDVDVYGENGLASYAKED